MKKLILIVPLVIALVTIAACTKGNESSMEEISYVVNQIPDYQQIVETMKITSFGIGLHNVNLEKTSPEIKTNRTYFNGIVIYKTKTGKLKMCFLDDSRPPKILATKELN